jgi:hypothetical protein
MNAVLVGVAVMLAFAVLLVVVLRPLFRLVRWEIAMDWRIAMFGWHAFLAGCFVGAVALLVVLMHWHVHLS